MIDLNSKHLETIQRILAEHVPKCEVRAFGSRVKWTAKDYSDLDLAVVGSELLSRRQLRRLTEAFEESDVPIRVDVVDWQSLSDWFKQVIAAEYKVIQKAEPAKENRQPEGICGKSGSTDRQLVIFEELFDISLRNGLTRPRAVRGSGVKMVNMGELFAHSRIGNIPMERVPLSEAEAEKYLLKKGDLLFARQSLVHSGAGKCSIFLGASEPITYEGHLIRARLNPSIADPVFYFYFFNSRLGRQIIESIIEQVAAAGIRGSDLAKLSVLYLPVEKQRQIAYLLGTLDDKIELNRQMNETLEAIARAIFKSWFVDFDPVRAKMEGRMPAGMDAATAILFPSAFQDSPLGKIPEGWEVVSLPEAIEVNPRRVLKKGTTSPYLHMQNLPTQGHRPDNWTHREFNSGTKFINGDTLLARITPCIENGKTGFVDFLDEEEVGWGSTEYIVLRPKPPLPVEFGYYLARSNDLRTFAIHNMTGTTGRQRVPASCFDHYHFPVPTTPIAQQFSEIVQPFMEKIRVNSEQSRTLSQIRDALLPKLLSGEIRVDDVDKRLEVKDGGTS